MPDSAGNPVFYFKDHANDQRITTKQKGVIEQVAEGKAVIMVNANGTILPDTDPNYSDEGDQLWGW